MVTMLVVISLCFPVSSECITYHRTIPTLCYASLHVYIAIICYDEHPGRRTTRRGARDCDTLSQPLFRKQISTPLKAVHPERPTTTLGWSLDHPLSIPNISAFFVDCMVSRSGWHRSRGVFSCSQLFALFLAKRIRLVLAGSSCSSQHNQRASLRFRGVHVEAHIVCMA